MDSKVKTNIFALLFSFLIPPLGVFLYLINNNATPTRGRKYGIASLLGAFMYLGGYVFIKALIHSFLSSLTNGAVSLLKQF